MIIFYVFLFYFIIYIHTFLLYFILFYFLLFKNDNLITIYKNKKIKNQYKILNHYSFYLSSKTMYVSIIV
jgi:hypothetical protein